MNCTPKMAASPLPCETRPNIAKLADLGVIRRVSTKWRDIGIRFGIDRSTLDNYQKMEMSDKAGCCVRVFDSWIGDGGTTKYPVSWKGVYEILCDVDHRAAAINMKAELANATKVAIDASPLPCETRPNTTKLADLGVIRRVSTKWRDIGIRFGIDLRTLDDYQKMEMSDNAGCCVRVFDSWIGDGGTTKYPVSWKGVYDVLCAAEHRGAANNMKAELAKAGINF